MVVGILIIAVAYLIGSLSAALIICRLLSLPDPRSNGSGNAGATNMLRLHGKKLGLLNLTIDVLKAVLPLLAIKMLGLDTYVLVGASFAILIGHLFPVWFDFKGGKGVACFIGILLVLNWHLALIYLIAWLIVAYISRYASLAALIAVIPTLCQAWYLDHISIFFWTYLVLALLLIFTHRANIYNLYHGCERKLG